MQSIQINIESDPVTLDPRKARDLTTVSIIHMLFEGLTRTSKFGDIEMALAENVDISEDCTEFTFHLRKSFWSNGDPVTSFDFAASWKSILDPKFPTDIAYQLYVIKNARLVKIGEVGLEELGIYTPDADTLVVKLEEATPYFLELVSMTSFFPISEKCVRNSDWALQPETHVGNGPFSIVAWKHADQIRVVRNRNYWESGLVKLEEVNLLRMTSDTEMKMFEEGKLDWAGSPLSNIPADAVSFLKKAEKLHSAPFAATYFFRVNTLERMNEKKNPLASANFRRSLAIAVNRKGITDHILQGGQRPAMSLVPLEMGLSSNGYFEDFNLEKARLLLKAALDELGLSLKTLEPIVISYSEGIRNAAIVQAIQMQWESGLGIPVRLEAVEPKIYFKRISQKEFQLAASSWVADFNDPINFLEVFKYKDASTNNTNWENPKYIDLLNQSALCKVSKERKKLLREAEEVLMEDMPILPVYFFSMNYLKCERLDDVAISTLGQIDFRWAHMLDNPSFEVR